MIDSKVFIFKRRFHVQVLTGAKLFPAKDDKIFIEFLKKNSSVSFEHIEASSVEEWLETIQHARLFVSGRNIEYAFYKQSKDDSRSL